MRANYNTGSNWLWIHRVEWLSCFSENVAVADYVTALSVTYLILRQGMDAIVS